MSEQSKRIPAVSLSTGLIILLLRFVPPDGSGWLPSCVLGVLTLVFSARCLIVRISPTRKVGHRLEAEGLYRALYEPAFPSITDSDASIHAGFNVMKTLWRPTPNG